MNVQGLNCSSLAAVMRIDKSRKRAAFSHSSSRSTSRFRSTIPRVERGCSSSSSSSSLARGDDFSFGVSTSGGGARGGAGGSGGGGGRGKKIFCATSDDDDGERGVGSSGESKGFRGKGRKNLVVLGGLSLSVLAVGGALPVFSDRSGAEGAKGERKVSSNNSSSPFSSAALQVGLARAGETSNEQRPPEMSGLSGSDLAQLDTNAQLDDMSRVKRLLKKALAEVLKLNERVDEYERHSGGVGAGVGRGSMAQRRFPFSSGGGGGIESSLQHTMAINDSYLEGYSDPSTELAKQASSECGSSLDLTLHSGGNGGDTNMRVKLRALDPHQGGKLELNNIILETKVSENCAVKFSPFGSHASELIQQLHPLCNCGLSRITRKGSDFLHSCRGMLLSSSWNGSSFGLHGCHSFSFSGTSSGSFSPRASSAGSRANKATHTIGQAVLKVMDDFVISISTRVASSYQKLTVEDGASALRKRNLGYTHTLSQSISGVIRLHGDVLMSGWVSSSSKEMDEWYVGLSNLASNHSGWGLSLSSPMKADPLKKQRVIQAEAFCQYQIADNLYLTPGVIHLKRGGRSKSVLMLRSEWNTT